MKILLMALALILTTGTAMAQKKVKKTTKTVESAPKQQNKPLLVSHSGYGMAGCGLGSIIFGQDSSRGIQILASTTNGTSLNNTFGVTFGTLNCTPLSSTASVDTKQNMIKFISANKQELETDVSKNGGETVDSLAAIMQVDDKKAFSAKLQKNYSTIFTHTEATDIANAILELI